MSDFTLGLLLGGPMWAAVIFRLSFVMLQGMVRGGRP
jgi:hypothetical protein